MSIALDKSRVAGGQPGTATTPDSAAKRRRAIPGWFLVFGVVLTLLALGFRAAGVGGAPYWGDELVSVTVGQMHAAAIPGYLAENDPHPPLYYLALHFWMLLAGNGEFATRWLSVLLGAAAVPMIGALGRRMFGPVTGVLAMTILATNPLHLAQARDARMYTLSVALTLGAALALWELYRRPRRWLWAAYIVLGTASLYTHYYNGLALLAQGLFVLTLVRSKPRFVLQFVLASAAIVLLYLPWLLPGLTVIGSYEGYGQSADDAGSGLFPSAVARCLRVFTTGYWSPDGNAAWLIGALVIALASAGVVAAWRRGWSRAVFLLLGLFVPITLIYVASLQRPLFTPKYLIVASPAFFLLLAVGVRLLSRSGRLAAPLLAGALLAPVLIVQVTGASELLGNPQFANADWRAGARLVDARAEPGDGIIYGHDGIKWLFGYYHTAPMEEYIPPFIVKGHEHEIDSQLQAFAGAHDRIWFVPWWQSDADVYVERWLTLNGYTVMDRWLDRSVRVQLYALASGEPARTPTDVVYGGTLKLEGWGLDRTSAAPGDILRLALDWRAVEDVEENVKVIARLVDDRGRTFAESDRAPRNGPTEGWPSGDGLTDRIGLLIPPGTPPGSYKLDLDVYQADSGERLTPAVTNAPRQRVYLTTVTIAPTTRAFPLAAIEAGTVLGKEILPGVMLAGYSITPGTRRAGDLVPAVLYWRSSKDGAIGDAIVEAVQGATVIAREQLATLDQNMKAGEVLRRDVTLHLSPTAAGGTYTIRVRPVSGGEATTLAALDVVQRPSLPPVAPPAIRLDAALGDVATLEGATVAPDGDGLKVTLVWRASRQLDTNYTVFVQVLNSANQVIAQSDQQPADGAWPTTAWESGDRIADEHVLVKTVPPGGRLIAGMYDPFTWKRLPVGGTDFVEIPW